MHPDHSALLAQLRAMARPSSHGRSDPSAYLGSDHGVLSVSVPDRRAIAKAWIASHRSASPEEVLGLAQSLFDGATHEEKTLAALLIGAHRRARQAAGPAAVGRWLDQLVGWAEVDSLCQNLFPAEQLLADWPGWSALIRRLAGDANINRRRAALVLLVGPVTRSDDERLRDLAFETIERLKGERPILITKAVSWLLRALAARHADAVRAYLDRQGPTLPAIAVRETRTKLDTGRKTARRRAVRTS